MSLFKKLTLSFALLSLSACGFQPLYGQHSVGNASEEFSTIRIMSIKDRIGQQLHNRLLTALNPKGAPGNPVYILNTQTTENTASLAVRKSAFATRANLKIQATFQLVPVTGDGKQFTGSSSITVSYNILDSDFATLSAEKDARKRAVREIAEEMRAQLGAHFSRIGSQKSKASQ